MTDQNPEGDPQRMHIAFNEAETRQALQFAQWYGHLCRAHGAPPPPDPLRALLACTAVLYDRVLTLESILADARVDPRDYLPRADTKH